jgi:predicted nicotinamide N-methyase
LESLLKRKNLSILELGAGCGIVGITFHHSLPDISKIILTDLPEASEILALNLSSLSPPNINPAISHQVLNWSSPLPSNISSTRWDLVVVADCTYNPDVVPDLVSSLTRLREGNKEAKVLLAMKVRHESEMAFFELMSEAGFVVKEKCAVGLGMVGQEDREEGEEIEIFVFGGQG